jgi:hypothetical protein
MCNRNRKVSNFHHESIYLLVVACSVRCRDIHSRLLEHGGARRGIARDGDTPLIGSKIPAQ